MTAIGVRRMTELDRKAWRAMREALWPEAVENDADIDEILAADDAWSFIAEREGIALGFAEVSVRKGANGCESRPVPFLEGIWIDPDARRQGLGARLIAHITLFLMDLGFTELGSDSLIDNHTAHDAHRAWGFSETERVVYFRKPL
jgi:aminoglycoside 6'-N-acetyltransferase I